MQRKDDETQNENEDGQQIGFKLVGKLKTKQCLEWRIKNTKPAQSERY